MCACRHNLSFSSATKISSHATSSPPCFNGERRCLSVYTLHLIVPPHLRKKPADFGDLSSNMPYCQCTGDCIAVMCVGCLPNSGELFAGTANTHHRLSMTSIKNEMEVLTFILSLSCPEMAEAALPSSHSGANL